MNANFHQGEMQMAFINWLFGVFGGAGSSLDHGVGSPEYGG
jgi:hypothetical protein